MPIQKEVLLVDDLRDPSDVRKHQDELTNEWICFEDEEVEIARTGEEGINLLQTRRWETLLLDNDMGAGIEGHEVLSFLQDNPQHLPSVIILVTANIIAGNRMSDDLRILKANGLIRDFGWRR